MQQFIKSSFCINSESFKKVQEKLMKRIQINMTVKWTNKKFQVLS